MTELQAHPAFRDKMPSRNSVGNRHTDLREKGYLRQVERGTYELAPKRETATPDTESRTVYPAFEIP